MQLFRGLPFPSRVARRMLIDRQLRSYNKHFTRQAQPSENNQFAATAPACRVDTRPRPVAKLARSTRHLPYLAPSIIRRTVERGGNGASATILPQARVVSCNTDQATMRRGLQIGKLFGIPILLDPSWLIIFGALTYLLSVDFAQKFPQWTQTQHWFVGSLTSLLFFGSVLFHELSHSVVARHYKIRVMSITL